MLGALSVRPSPLARGRSCHPPLFCAGLFAFFNDTFNEWMMGWVSSTGNEANPLLYIILVLVGVNFLIEMGINLVLSPIIERIIRLRKKGAV